MTKYIVITAINEKIQTPKAFNSHKEAVEEVKKRINREMEGHAFQFSENDWGGHWVKGYHYAIRKVEI